MDENRAVDGVDLRYTYAEHVCEMNAPSGPEDDLPCTMLEMLVALAMRCNDWILCDVENRYGYWFWKFIENLGLLGCTDDNFDIIFVKSVIERLLERRYKPSGEGGLFPLSCTCKDQRRVDIWSQLGYFLDETYFS